MKPIVYFTRDRSPQGVLKLYRKLGITLPGKVAVKVHSGEVGNQNFLRPIFWKDVVEFVDGTIVETNTAYDGSRNTTQRHMATFKQHGWSEYFTIDLLDAVGPDLVLEIPDGKQMKKNYIGKDTTN